MLAPKREQQVQPHHTCNQTWGDDQSQRCTTYLNNAQPPLQPQQLCISGNPSHIILSSFCCNGSLWRTWQYPNTDFLTVLRRRGQAHGGMGQLQTTSVSAWDAPFREHGYAVPATKHHTDPSPGMGTLPPAPLGTDPGWRQPPHPRPCPTPGTTVFPRLINMGTEEPADTALAGDNSEKISQVKAPGGLAEDFRQSSYWQEGRILPNALT